RGQDMNASAADLSSLALDLKTLAHTLASNSDHLDTLIADLRKVMETLAAWHADFRAMLADWDHVMATLASREENLKGTIVEQDRVMAILDQALSGGAAQQLHGALAEAPATIDNANQCLGGLSLIALNMGLRGPWSNDFALSAEFTTANGLVPQAEVRVSGVHVGTVTEITDSGGGDALVRMALQPGIQLRQDTRAVIRP